MFRARDPNGKDVISLLISPEERPTFHDLAAADGLRCPECRQPVWFKAGEVREYHFAHKDRGKCPMGTESAALLQVRAALFRKLSGAFGSAVTIEQSFEGLPRVVDCYVDGGEDKRWAYWIVESRLPERWSIRGILRGRGIHVHWVFLAKMMQRNDKPAHVLNLTPTERDLLEGSPFDEIYRNASFPGVRGSLHYFDPDKEALTTFRGMQCSHYPQEHVGTEITTSWEHVEVIESTGELAHPGERAGLAAHEERLRAEAEQKRREEKEQQRLSMEWRRNRSFAQPVPTPIPTPIATPIPKGLNVYEMYWSKDNRAGFWIMHRTWTDRHAQVRSIGAQTEGRLAGAPPFHGYPPVIVDIYDARTGVLLQAGSLLEAPGSYDYRLLQESG